MRWIGFQVTFPTDTDVVITVSYIMGSVGSDGMQNIDYVLETGAGWYGPIERAYIVAKFPYVASHENILKSTSPGYQMLYNEIFWSFQNLEPTSKDNIRVSIVSPDTWESILSLRQKISENPAQPDTWLELLQAYSSILRYKMINLHEDYYYKLLTTTYKQALKFNPDNAELYARYAMFQIEEKSPYQFVTLTTSEAAPIAALISKALSLDPENETANTALSALQVVSPDLTFTPPPVMPPTVMPEISSTPSLTPLPSVTPKMGQAPIFIEMTVVQTQIVTAAPERITVSPSALPPATLTPIPEPKSGSENKTAGTTWFIWPILLVVGFAGGAFISKKKWI
jgi:hypothetical protein